MKSSLGKLRRFAALHKNDHKEKLEFPASAQLDELAQASKDMQAMKNCYDSLFSAAAATANSAYEFSESLHEMGTCLLEKSSHGDEETGRVLSMLGQVQFELQKLIDSYRSHIFLTIINPSESLLSELRTVEGMKRQCDEKRDVYEYMITQQREKGKSKSGKVEIFSLEKIQRAHDEYEEDATLCVFRLKSLKQGQSRSLLTQAARHHAAQLNFFQKGLKSLEAVEPHVRMVTEQQHIDYQFSGLEADGADGADDSEDNDVKEDGEQSFDYRQDVRAVNTVSTSKNSMEVDGTGLSYGQSSTAESAEMVNTEKGPVDVQIISSRENRTGSHSAPIFAEKKFDPPEKSRHVQQSSPRKSSSYVLPTPFDAKSLPSQATAPRHRQTSFSGQNQTLWHSSPLDLIKQDIKSVPESRESNNNNSFSQLPPPLVERFVPNTEKVKRHAFSGPITSKPMSKKPVLTASGPIFPSDFPQPLSKSTARSAQPSSSPKASPNASPPLVSSPRISELHELPRPPGNLAVKPVKSSAMVGHSAPLVLRNPEGSGNNKIPTAASPLPPPPLIVPRSFSIPSSSQRAMGFNVVKTVESHQVSEKVEEVSSPPLTPLLLPVSTVAACHSGTIRGE